ncbi:MAG: 50S ribosomal protein L18Ae [Candidatus Kariarchaeaceae archaeon]
MSDTANIFRIKGFFIKGKTRIPLTFECRAYKEEDALEKAFSEIGSRHRVKRDRIFIERGKGIEIISAEEAVNPEFSEMDDASFKIYR